MFSLIENLHSHTIGESCETLRIPVAFSSTPNWMATADTLVGTASQRRVLAFNQLSSECRPGSSLNVSLLFVESYFALWSTDRCLYKHHPPTYLQNHYSRALWFQILTSYRRNDIAVDFLTHCSDIFTELERCSNHYLGSHFEC